MKQKSQFSSMQPSVVQQYLLNCCLTEYKETFLENWKKWKANQDFEFLDYESLKLISLLNEQLSHFQLNDENQPRYQGIYKKQWVNNVQLFSNVSFISEKFQKAGISFKIIKNAAFVKMYYHDNGLLQLFGVDVFIRHQDLEAAIDILMHNGYVFNNDATTKTSAFNSSALIKQIGFKNKTNQQLVLHVHPFKLIRGKQVEDVLFNNGLLFNLNEELALPTFNHTQHLFYTIVNGVSEKPRAMLQWAVDFKTIAKLQTINWNEFVFYTQQFKATLIVRYAFDYLSQVCKLEIPELVLKELMSITPDKEELIEFNNFIRQHKYDKLRYSFSTSKQLKKARGFTGGYLDYIQLQFNVKTALQLPKIILSKLLR